MVQSGDMAAKLGTLADAKQFFTQVAERRQKRGDKKGATEIGHSPRHARSRGYTRRACAPRKLATESGDTTTALREYKGRGRQAREERNATPTRSCR